MRLFILGLLLLLLASCEDGRSEADVKQTKATDELATQANAQTGMPGITQFTERKIVRKLYELRDKNVSTFTYIQDMQGKLWHVCDSIGYGLPYGVQFTAPERPLWGDHGNIVIPQPEPNGLFMPPTADGTWVICGGKDGDFQPVYIEPRVIVSPFKLNAAGDYLAK